MSTANFALRGFCPNVLTLKAVLMMLDLPGPQRRMANRQCAHRHRINTDMFYKGRSQEKTLLRWLELFLLPSPSE
jgi:hypothetical protein